MTKFYKHTYTGNGTAQNITFDMEMPQIVLVKNTAPSWVVYNTLAKAKPRPCYE